MNSSMTMTPMLKTVTMITDAPSPSGAPLAPRGTGRRHRLPRPGAGRLPQDEGGAEVRDHDRQQGLGRGEAHENPDREETPHDRVEADVGERPEGGAHHHADGGEAHGIARGDEGIADRPLAGHVHTDLLEAAAQ